MDYLESQNHSSAYKADLLHYLDENVTAINGPADVIDVFGRVKRGRRHLWLAMRVLFNYLEALGLDPEVLAVLRKLINAELILECPLRNRSENR